VDRVVKRKKKAKKNIKKSFINRVSKFSGNRLHVEVPKKERENFNPGDSVRVEKIE
jgi:hypothetical protein